LFREKNLLFIGTHANEVKFEGWIPFHVNRTMLAL